MTGKSFFKCLKGYFTGPKKSKNYPVVELAEDADNLLINSSCLHCPVCYEVFGIAPDVLMCGHSFCSSCVEKLRSDAQYVPSFSSFVYECPFCRHHCTVEDPPIRNFAIEAIIESVSENTHPIHPEEHLVANLRYENRRLWRNVTALEDQKRALLIKVDEKERLLRHTIWLFAALFLVLLAKLYHTTRI
uniref:RING-type domain-containing protein n=1 Tax=Steinernema glaseri TaxID=37863 RepID=A0A1I8AAB1_9BILA